MVQRRSSAIAKRRKNRTRKDFLRNTAPGLVSMPLRDASPTLSLRRSAHKLLSPKKKKSEIPLFCVQPMNSAAIENTYKVDKSYWKFPGLSPFFALKKGQR